MMRINEKTATTCSLRLLLFREDPTKLGCLRSGGEVGFSFILLVKPHHLHKISSALMWRTE